MTAELDIEEISVIARCKECSAEWTIHEPAFKCTECGTGNIDIISGRELDIASIEIED